YGQEADQQEGNSQKRDLSVHGKAQSQNRHEHADEKRDQGQAGEQPARGDRAALLLRGAQVEGADQGLRMFLAPVAASEGAIKIGGAFAAQSPETRAAKPDGVSAGMVEAVHVSGIGLEGHICRTHGAKRKIERVYGGLIQWPGNLAGAKCLT